MAQNTDAMDAEQETDEFVPEDVDAEEWFRMTSPRVRAFVEDAVNAEQIGTPEVLKAGDVGAMLSPEFENGTLTGRVFEVAENHGFTVAEVNFSEEEVLFHDKTEVGN